MKTVNQVNHLQHVPVSLRKLKTPVHATAGRAAAMAENMDKTSMNLSDKSLIFMGQPITAPCLIPVLHSSTPSCINNPFIVNGELYGVTALSFGSPHGAVFVDDVDNVDVPALGSAIGTHPLFPKGASIVFIQVLDKETLKVRLWQRDQGEAAFTPEAACVAGAAAMMLQKVSFNEATVNMGGNSLLVQWDRANDGVLLTGPADLMTA